MYGAGFDHNCVRCNRTIRTDAEALEEVVEWYGEFICTDTDAPRRCKDTRTIT